MLTALSRYANLFASLNRNLNSAPHKPVLLLTLLSEIDRGAIASNLVRITPELVAAFRIHWRALVVRGNWQDRIATPFLHLTSDRFWELVKNGESVTLQQFGTSVSVKQLQTMVDGGRFVEDLWNLLSDAVARRTLRRILLTTYFPQHELALQTADIQNPLEAEAERLIAAADRPFRIKINQKEIDLDGADGSYVRSAVFPRVIKNLYGATCAVCGMDVRNGQSDALLIDAAHVVPFSVSHNDDPRNGLALCRNHHAGFDHGWYSVTENYRIVVSSRLTQSIPYVRSGEPLRLPANAKYAPAREALAWHRNHNRLDGVM